MENEFERSDIGEIKKQTARIEDWRVVSASAGAKFIIGIFFDHPVIKDGTHGNTARLSRLDEAKGEAETPVTFYKLGKKA